MKVIIFILIICFGMSEMGYSQCSSKKYYKNKCDILNNFLSDSFIIKTFNQSFVDTITVIDPNKIIEDCLSSIILFTKPIKKIDSASVSEIKAINFSIIIKKKSKNQFTLEFYQSTTHMEGYIVVRENKSGFHCLDSFKGIVN